jgi:hypothetical protein
MSAPREVLLLGSVPLRPAAKVLEAVGAHLGPLAPRIPDGEAMGWLREIWASHARNPGLEPAGTTRLSTLSPLAVPLFRPRPGAADLKLGPYGYPANAAASHAALVAARDAGKVPAGTRLQVTMPGPGTTAYCVRMAAETLLPLAREALWREIEGVLAAVPARDLALQLDVAMEAEHEEYLRRPEAFETPVQTMFHWTHDQMADSVAWLANRVPPEVELGFHICSIWHHWPRGGQDNAVLVETANALSARIARPIAYIQIPIVPEHDAPEHYAPFKALKLHPETRLNLGLINLADGVEGARKRIALAKTAVADFGVSFFCGLGMPPAPGAAPADPPIPALRRATADTIGAVLDLHRKIAELQE